MNTTINQMENKLDIDSLSLEEKRELIKQLERSIEESCNVATPYIKTTIDSCYSDVQAATIDITDKILEDFERWQGGGKLIDVIVNLMNWYRNSPCGRFPKLNLIFQPDTLDNEEAQQFVMWPSQKAAALRNHPNNESYRFVKIQYERETRRLGIFCSTVSKPQRNTFLKDTIRQLLEAQPHTLTIPIKALPSTYAINKYNLKQHLMTRLPDHIVSTYYYPDSIIISLQSKNNT